MSKPSYESEIRNFYTEMELEPETVERLLDAIPFAAAAKRWKRIAIAASIGLAAMLLLTVSLLLSSFKSESRQISPVDHRETDSEQSAVIPDVKKSVSAQSVQPEKQPLASPVEYRLVAFRSHNNQCPHCRATGQVFRELTESLDEPTIETQEFDLSDPAARAETQQRIEEWKLNPIIDGRSETAFIALTDANGRMIQEFKPSQGTGGIAKQIRKILDR
ncbi:hypothetical protein Pan241w_19500 [Gimesia alba]|uniref:Thioredoxin domain-containing protein n=1 Tax=Gimesia alba TaxID=2527973 RepID=A0A517RDC3_9PLAN|nr:hypothetical protein [Gimesia alba]QDT41882.1 hypothetical protein Pan241w_19500 [Gimesia alba]